MDSSPIVAHIYEMLLSLEAIPKVQFPQKSGIGENPDAILIQRRCKDVRINSHGQSSYTKLFHERFVLTIALDGSGVICCNSHTYPLTPGNAALVYPYQYHHYLVDQSSFFWCIITFTMERAFFPEKLYNRSVPCNDERTLRIVARMLELYIQFGGNHPLVRCYLGCLVGELEAGIEATPNMMEAGRASVEQSDNLQLFERVNGYICMHLSDEWLTPERLIEEFHVSRSKLYMNFKKYLDCSPADYIRRLRLEYACRLLRKSEAPLGSIAAQCGFSSQSVFNRCFLREFEVTPSHYLKQNPGASSEHAGTSPRPPLHR